MNKPRAADLAALGAILAAGALSTLWVFLVPIFQPPDEAAHFDYAVSIYSAQRLVRLSDGPRDWIVSPYTKYLLRVSDQQRIAGHSPMRVPPGYGTRAYYAAVDAAAPRLDRRLPSEGVSYIAPTYPFGFYALEAVVIRAATAFTDSIVTVFFAARLFCVFLTMLGLYFNYRTGLALGVPRWTSVALIAAIGIFPMTSAMSSAVQPDNLAYLLISATLFVATAWRAGVQPLRIAGVLGVLLGLLAITKYHFFLSVALPVLLLAAVRLRSPIRAAKRAIAAALLIVPSALLLAVQHWGVGESRRSVGSAVASFTEVDALRTALAGGAGSALHYVAGTSVAGFVDCFISGFCAATFWRVLGPGDTPIVIANAGISLLVRVTVSLATLAVAIVLVYYGARALLRLAKAALRGHAGAALRAIAADPVINSYFLFVALMLGLYVLTNDAYGAAGRHWYPYVFPAFLCFVWYAPRALRKEHRRLSAALACVLLAYSAIAAAYSIAGITQRFYTSPTGTYAVVDPPPAEVSAAKAVGALWPLQPAEYHVAGSNVQFDFRKDTRLLITGVAAGDGNIPARIAVVLDGRQALPVLTGEYIIAIAELTFSTANGYSGFSAYVPANELSEGPHVISAYAQAPGESSFARIHPMRLFFITANGGFSNAYRQSLAPLPAVTGNLEAAGLCRNRSVLLLRGRIARAPGTIGVWLLDGERPYPAKYDPTDGSFVAMLPLAALTANGPVTAYALAPNARTQGPIGNGLVLDAATQTRLPNAAPSSCADPLRELQLSS